MALTTALTERLGITHPILSAPMFRVAGGKLAAAVTGAGGLGLIGGGYVDEAAIDKAWEEAGNQAVGIGFITWALKNKPEALSAALERRPAAVMLSFGEEQPFARKVKQAGVPLICQIQSVAEAKRALDNGADVIVAQGAEAGGHGAARATLPLAPAVVDAVGGEVPVVAAGGVADGRGLAAALMLGASGVLMGTRFYASQEAQVDRKAFERILAATGDETIKTRAFDFARGVSWPADYTIRGLANAWTDAWHGREAEFEARADKEQLRARYAAAAESGDFDMAGVISGEAIGLIHDAPPAGEIVTRIVGEAEALLRGAPDYAS